MSQLDIQENAGEKIEEVEDEQEIVEDEQEAEEEEEYDEKDARRFDNLYFLLKHTPSFKCLEQYLCSHSDLFTTLSFFPPLEDPGLDEIFNYIPPEEPIDFTGIEKYKKMCKDLEIVAISRVIKSLRTDTLNLKYYGLTLKQMRGICDALKVNSDVKVCIFQDNWMCPESCDLISDILRESNSLRVLNLRECRIGPEGAEKISEGIGTTQFLQELDLSYNGLGDQGLLLLKSSLIENTSIKTLNLSHNELTEESGQVLGQIFKENKVLEDVNLSWNGFYTPLGNKKMFKGLTENENVKRLNMSWSGIGTRPAILPITKYLKKTQVLEYLDFDFNRICMGSYAAMRGALIKNQSLREVRLGNNLYDPDQAAALAQVLLRRNHQLESIDMENMCVKKDFLPLARRIKQMGKNITYGHVLNNYEIYGPSIPHLLFKRCNYLAMKPKKKKQKKDFGHFILSLPERRMPRDDFEKFLKKKKVKKIDKDLLKELMNNFSTKGQKVDCDAMRNEYMKYFPDTVLPPPPEKKKKKGKKGKKKKKGKKGEEATPATTAEGQQQAPTVDDHREVTKQPSTDKPPIKQPTTEHVTLQENK